MGIFTWTLADMPREKLGYGATGTILCPDNRKITEKYYDGYGIFDGNDAYNLVADWNREHLSKIIEKIKKKDGENFWGSNLLPVMKAFEESGDEKAQEEADKLFADSGSYLRREWKRNIGITISCEHNDILPYPLKIVTQYCSKYYDELPPSVSTQ